MGKEDLLAIEDNFMDELDDVKEQLATIRQSMEQLATMRQSMEQLATMRQSMEQLAIMSNFGAFVDIDNSLLLSF